MENYTKVAYRISAPITTWRLE